MKKRSFCTALCILLFVCLGCLPVWSGPAEAAAPEVEAALLLIPVLITEAAALAAQVWEAM